MIRFSEIHAWLLVWAPLALRFAAGVELLCIVWGVATKSVSLILTGAMGLVAVALSYRVVKLAAEKPPPSTRIAAYFFFLIPLLGLFLAVATHVEEVMHLFRKN